MNANYITINGKSITALITALKACGSDHVRIESGYLGSNVHAAEFRTMDGSFVAVVYNEVCGDESISIDESETSPEIPFPAKYRPLRTVGVPTISIVDTLRRCERTALIALAANGDQRNAAIAVTPYKGTADKYIAMRLCVDLWLTITNDEVDIGRAGRTPSEKAVAEIHMSTIDGLVQYPSEPARQGYY